MVRASFGWIVAWMALGAAGWAASDFERDVLPVLQKHCYSCHDGRKQQAGFRLDVRNRAFKGGESGEAAIIAKDAAGSPLLKRILSADEADRMPPEGPRLMEHEVASIRNWIDEGATWPDALAGNENPGKDHWGFKSPVRAEVPQVADKGRNAVDQFVHAKLAAEGLNPAPEADKTTLLRRLSLDLIGLPPTIEEVDAFLADNSSDAYEKQVERLLASPHFGERWGRIWLDAARYADSDGFEKDKPRFVWFYRDWVINALNRDLPYDQFIIEQLAGDLLPEATQDQKVATGFLRNSMINEEGGVDPEQFRMEAMFDRMDAVGKSMLGLTIQCAQCHDHKFDPLTQADYYRMFAFLNNSSEGSLAVYTPAQDQQRSDIFRQVAELEDELKHKMPDWRERMAAWEETVVNDQPNWTVVRPDYDPSGSQKHYVLDDGSILAQGYAPTQHTTDFTVKTDLPTVTAVRVELLNDPNLPMNGPGRSIDGLCALTEFHLSAASLEEPGKESDRKIASATADANPAEKELDPIYDNRSGKRRVTGPIGYAIDGNNETAWGIDVAPGRSNVPRNAVFVLAEPISHEKGSQLTFKLTQNHGGWNSDDNQNNNLGRFRLSVTDAAGATADTIPAKVREILARPESERSEADDNAVFRVWRQTIDEWKDVNARIEALWQSHPRPESQMTLKERAQPRMTSMLKRGDFLHPGAPVSPGVPAFLNSMPDDPSVNRLSFARWMTDRNAPTTARSIVNRLWQAYFGIGLVATSEDLGTQAERPSNPELFDWLAVELMEPTQAATSGDALTPWSLKHLHRLIVTSATYRQASRVSPELASNDPYNRLLARGPRFRVDAEIVRDIFLAASGLLNPEIGGESVHPPLPAFMVQPPVSYGPKTWNEDKGPDRYRRALYTFRFRSIPYPVLQTFDAPNGDFACVRRSRSNTPLQALMTLNEPIFVECAQALALKTLAEGGKTDESRLDYAFRRTTSRQPTTAEKRALLGLLTEQQKAFEAPDAKPWQFVAADPEHPPMLPEGTTPAQAAAWTAVARVVLNLDEAISKE